jgi:hypothetical protein
MKKSGLLARQKAYIQAREAEVRHHTQVYTLDMVTAALGRMGFGEKRLRQFDETLTQVSKDYAELILEDVKTDEEIVYAKACLDRELKQYTGSLFRPYEERYK